MTPHFLHVGILTTTEEVDRIRHAVQMFPDDQQPMVTLVETYLHRNNRVRDLTPIESDEVGLAALNEKLAVLHIKSIEPGTLNRNKVRYIKSALARLGALLELGAPMTIVGEFQFMIQTAVTQVKTFVERPRQGWDCPLDDDQQPSLDDAIRVLLEAMVPLFEPNIGRGRVAIAEPCWDAVEDFEDRWEQQPNAAIAFFDPSFWEPFHIGQPLGFSCKPFGGPVYCCTPEETTWQLGKDAPIEGVVVHFPLLEFYDSDAFAPWCFPTAEAIAFGAECGPDSV